MSIYEDFFEDSDWNNPFPFGIPGETWPSKSGPIKVSEMSDDYIHNVMNMVGEDDLWYHYFQEELKKRHIKENNIPHICSTCEYEYTNSQKCAQCIGRFKDYWERKE
jgi:hypothetical protein